MTQLHRGLCLGLNGGRVVRRVIRQYLHRQHSTDMYTKLIYYL